MSGSSDKLRGLWPEFASDPADAIVDLFIETATSQMSVTRWGKLFELGAITLAAHMLALRKRSLAAAGSALGGPVGGLTALSTGDESISFGAVGAATAGDEDTSLRTTPYGLEYLRLKSMLVLTPINV